MINEFIKTRRTELGLSRKLLCDNLCSESTLYRFERGIQDINSHLLVEICKRLKLETVVVTDINLTEKEYALFILIQHYIYKKDIIELEKILDSLDSKQLSSIWIKITIWCRAVIFFYKQEFKLCENLICNELKLCDPKNSLDLLILNTLTLTYLSQNNYTKALEVATSCLKYINTHKLESIDINSKIKYSYAHSLFKNSQKNEAKKVITDLVDLLLYEKTFFLLGKCYFFLYILHLEDNYSLAQKYLKRSYMTFIAEGSDVPKQVMLEMKYLKNISLYL